MLSETSGSMLQMLYGYSVTSSDPLHLVKIVEDAMNGFSVASEPGKWWVDSFPLCAYLSCCMDLSLNEHDND